MGQRFFLGSCGDGLRLCYRPRLWHGPRFRIGAYLGQVLVQNLGGQWIPRQKLLETQVLVGTRVWLPFVRAWRYMRSCQSLLDSSLTQLFLTASRHQR